MNEKEASHRGNLLLSRGELVPSKPMRTIYPETVAQQQERRRKQLEVDNARRARKAEARAKAIAEE